MTETEIRTLTGPKLDTAIAEMMGWKKAEVIEIPTWFNRKGGFITAVGNWHPSTSWADLGRLVEWMEGEGWSFMMYTWTDYNDVKISRASVSVHAFGSTLPEAACRASLLSQIEK